MYRDFQKRENRIGKTMGKKHYNFFQKISHYIKAKNSFKLIA